MSNSEHRFEGLKDYATLIEWVDATQQNQRAAPLWYQGPVDDEPYKISATVDRSDPRNYVIRVSPWFLGPDFEPFEADRTHLRYFKRLVSDLDPPRPRPAERRKAPDQAPKSVDVQTLTEARNGELCVCVECKAHYYPFPYQSKTRCKGCLPPPSRCRHGLIEWVPCSECHRATGSATQRLGLR